MAALKEAVTLHATNNRSTMKAAQEMNEKYKLFRKKKLTKTMVSRYKNKRRIGVSTRKKERRVNLPSNFMELLNCHISMK